MKSHYDDKDRITHKYRITETEEDRSVSLGWLIVIFLIVALVMSANQ